MMARRTLALAALVALALPPASAVAEETRAQKVFEKRLLEDRSVAPAVKRTLRGPGFVDRGMRFRDVTGDGKSDALVMVNQGASHGRIAAYVFSSHRAKGAPRGLRIVFKRERLYRARGKLTRPGTARPLGSVVLRTPIYDPGDELADPGAVRIAEARWRPRRSRFRPEPARVNDNVRSRYCSRTGDVCTRTIKAAGGATYLELRTPSFRGRYFLCVTTPGGDTSCRNFTLRRSGDLFVSRVRWAANFPDGGRGRYAVEWRLGTDRLGPVLGFRRG